MLQMANHSHSTITFQWEPYTEEYILEIEPPFGELSKCLINQIHMFTSQLCTLVLTQ